MLAVVPGHGAVCGLGLYRAAVRRHQHAGHQAEGAEALASGVRAERPALAELIEASAARHMTVRDGGEQGGKRCRCGLSLDAGCRGFGGSGTVGGQEGKELDGVAGLPLQGTVTGFPSRSPRRPNAR